MSDFLSLTWEGLLGGALAAVVGWAFLGGFKDAYRRRKMGAKRVIVVPIKYDGVTVGAARVYHGGGVEITIVGGRLPLKELYDMVASEGNWALQMEAKRHG